MGEYARCLTIATALVRAQPSSEVHFALSRAAPYAATTPFATTLLPASPTFHSHEVCALIREFRPGAVLFDNAGRTLQLRAARDSGARIVFVSSRRRQRAKGFRLRWMSLIDEHWIAYPQFIAGALGPLEGLKVRTLGRPRIRFVDALLPAPDASLAAGCLARFGLRPREYLLIVPGGGTGHPGAETAPAIIAAAARAIAAQGMPTLLVGVQGGGDEAAPAQLRHAPLLPLPQLAELIRAARLVLTNGGDTLLQVLACERPCVAVPIAHDQERRIRCCVQAGLALCAELAPRSIESAVLALLAEGAERAALEARLAAHPVRNCLDEVLGALDDLARPDGAT